MQGRRGEPALISISTSTHRIDSTQEMLSNKVVLAVRLVLVTISIEWSQCESSFCEKYVPFRESIVSDASCSTGGVLSTRKNMFEERVIDLEPICDDNVGLSIPSECPLLLSPGG